MAGLWEGSNCSVSVRMMSRGGFLCCRVHMQMFAPHTWSSECPARLWGGRTYREPCRVSLRGCRNSKQTLLTALVMFTYFISALHICPQLDSAEAVIFCSAGIALCAPAGLRHRLQLLVSLQQALPALSVLSKITMPERSDRNGKFMALKEMSNIIECRKIIHKSALYGCSLHLLS